MQFDVAIGSFEWKSFLCAITLHRMLVADSFSLLSGSVGEEEKRIPKIWCCGVKIFDSECVSRGIGDRVLIKFESKAFQKF